MSMSLLGQGKALDIEAVCQYIGVSYDDGQLDLDKLPLQTCLLQMRIVAGLLQLKQTECVLSLCDYDSIEAENKHLVDEANSEIYHLINTVVIGANLLDAVSDVDLDSILHCSYGNHDLERVSDQVIKQTLLRLARQFGSINRAVTIAVTAMGVVRVKKDSGLQQTASETKSNLEAVQNYLNASISPETNDDINNDDDELSALPLLSVVGSH